MGVLHADISDLQNEIKQEDKKHGINRGATYRGFLLAYTETYCNISKTWHNSSRFARNSTLFIDATESVVGNVEGFEK